LGILINYLKSSNQWDESLVILTSDHGYWGALWKKHRDFALYEDRVRVPLMIKWPKSKGVPAGEVSTPTNATVGSLLDMLDAIDVSLPAYQKMLPQFDSKIKDMAICETVMQPERDDYALALVSDKYKYFFRCKINWDNFSMQKFLYHKLFMKIDGDFDETQDFSTIHNQEAEKFKNLAMEIVSANLDFLSKHQPINLKDLK
jgi:arylsulfatase A-like enzyme